MEVGISAPASGLFLHSARAPSNEATWPRPLLGVWPKLTASPLESLGRGGHLTPLLSSALCWSCMLMATSSCSGPQKLPGEEEKQGRRAQTGARMEDRGPKGGPRLWCRSREAKDGVLENVDVFWVTADGDLAGGVGKMGQGWAGVRVGVSLSYFELL